MLGFRETDPALTDDPIGNGWVAAAVFTDRNRLGSGRSSHQRWVCGFWSDPVPRLLSFLRRAQPVDENRLE